MSSTPSWTREPFLFTAALPLLRLQIEPLVWFYVSWSLVRYRRVSRCSRFLKLCFLALDCGRDAAGVRAALSPGVEALQSPAGV